MPGKFYQYCHHQKKVVPVENVMQRSPNAEIDHGIMTDDIAPTKFRGKTYTSMARYREATKAEGLEIVGNDWNDDHDPQKESDARLEKFHREKLHKDFKENLNDDAKCRAILEKRDFFRRNGHY